MLRFFDRIRRRIYDRPTVQSSADSTQAEREGSKQELLDEIVWNWPEREPFSVDAVLARYPELRDAADVKVELAMEEFNRRRIAGENLTPSGFANGFPSFRSALLDSLLFENMLEENSWFEQALLPKTPVRDVEWPAVGEEIAGFQLIDSLGSGGFSRVFLAEDLEFNRRRVALKICRNDTHEANTLADLQHSAIGAVHYVRDVPERGLTAICMPFCSRTTLHNVIQQAWHNGRVPRTAQPVWDQVRSRNRLERGNAPWAKAAFGDWALDLMILLARALSVSHDRNIIHCDLKPSNILISAEGAPILVDFNVAFRTSATASPGNVGGTLPYMAPEQIRAFAGQGFSDISGVTDVFGLGATIYELLTGRMPFRGAPTAQDGVRPLLNLRREPVTPIRQLNPAIDREFAAAVEACLHYEIADRPVSAEFLADYLEEIRQRRRVRRPVTRPTARGVLATVAAAVIAATIFLATPERSPSTGTEPVQLASLPGVPGFGPGSEIVPAEAATGLSVKAYDKFDAGDFDSALAMFTQASEIDPEHEAARLGRIRCLIHLGKAGEADEFSRKWTKARTLESLALNAYFWGLEGNWKLAVDAFQRVIDGGIDTPEMRTNLGYACFKLNRYDEATRILESVIRDSGNETGASLTLAAMYPLKQQQLEVAEKKALIAKRQRPMTNPVLFYDLDTARQLIEAAPEGGARTFASGLVYSFIASKLKTADPATSQQAVELALQEFDRGVELGYEAAHWNGLKMSLNRVAPDLAQTAIGKKYQDVRVMALAQPSSRLFLFDPIQGTSLDHWTGQKVSEVQPAFESTVVAGLAK